MFDNLKLWIGKLICRIRGYHNWKTYCYGGLGGSYYVTKCSCCEVEKPNSFTPEMTLCEYRKFVEVILSGGEMVRSSTSLSP